MKEGDLLAKLHDRRGCFSFHSSPCVQYLFVFIAETIDRGNEIHTENHGQV